MRRTDEKFPRRSSLTQFFSPIYHHEQVVRKRAQSLHAQSTRVNSILYHESTCHPNSEVTQTDAFDKNTFKLGISAPLPASSSSSRPARSDTETSSPLKQPRSSFIETRHHDEPPSSSERKVQFVEPEPLHHHRTRGKNHFTSVAGEPSSFSSDTTTRSASSACRNITPVKKRTVARVSISTGKLYYIQEPIPEYPFPSTYFSPPPSPSQSHAHHHRHHSHSFNFAFRRASQHHQHMTLAGVCPHLRQQSAASGLRYDCPIRNHDGRGCRSELQRGSESSGASTPSSIAQSESRERHHYNEQEEESPLYTSASEKFYAHWGTFAFNMRFSMFRAQDRMKDGVAWMADVVRRMKTVRQH